MIRRIGAHIRKELLLLLRDRAGLALLFVMPVCLVVIMAVVQDAPFRDFNDRQVQVLYADLDGGVVGDRLRTELERTTMFTVADADTMSEESLREAIRSGGYQVGIIVPAGASQVLEARATNILKGYIAPEEAVDAAALDSAQVHVLIDPTVKHAFRQMVHASVMAILVEVSSDRLLAGMRIALIAIKGGLPAEADMDVPFIGVHQEMAGRELAGDRVANDSTQHNVPAWTVFAMFFTVVLLGGNMVKERNSGCMTRLLTMPGSTAERIVGRIAAYQVVCAGQGALLLLAGILLLPVFGLPRLQVAGATDLLLLAAFVIALAATSFGVLIGAVSRTQQQSAVLGSTFVVIMSAIGGIWVPLYVMPPGMQAMGRMSPLHWSLEAFNVPLLRNGELAELVPCLAPLLLFSVACHVVAVGAERLASAR